MKQKMKKAIAVVCVATLMLTGCGTDKARETKKEAFSPSLDKNKKISLEIAGFLGNFEALDQLVNDFNKYYPNVSVTYEQNGADSLVEYLENNSYADIFMTAATNVDPSANQDMNVLDYCLDLSKEKMDTSTIEPELLKACTVDGKLVRIPLAKMMCGMVVNKTLLKKEGLTVPQTYQEFLEVCKTLKAKGYTPIQSSKIYAYSDLILPMAMSLIGSDEALSQKVIQKDASYAEELRTVFERLSELIEKGYLDQKVNETFPDDNYDGAILKFFGGKVPFWIANAEKFSGMKKRESKSDTFSKNPFSYEIVNVPLGDEGVFDYEEAWYGFSVNRNSEDLDYAVEFMRFLMTQKELDQMAQIKGMPSVTLKNTDKRFKALLHPEKCEKRYISDGNLGLDVASAIASAGNQMGAGKLHTVDEAIESLQKQIAK